MKKPEHLLQRKSRSGFLIMFRILVFLEQNPKLSLLKSEGTLFVEGDH